MEYEFIYSIALDLIEKRSKVKTNFISNETVCVLITEASSIFSNFNKYISENNRFENICAEKETLKIMKKSGETKIKALVVVDCTSKTPIIPCNDCKKEILNVNKDNYNTLIMLPNKTFLKLYETYNVTVSETISNPVQDDGWDEGWDDFQEPINSSNNSNLYADKSKYMTNGGNSSYIDNEKNPLEEINSFQARYTSEGTDSIYLNQGKYIREGSSLYITPVQQNTNQKDSKYFRNTSIYLKDSEKNSTTNGGSLYTQRLNNMLKDIDNIDENKSSQSNNQSLLQRKLASLVDTETLQEEETPEVSPKKETFKRNILNRKEKSQQVKKSKQVKKSEQLKQSQQIEQNSIERTYKYSKKELIIMAKDKKRQAKKDQKILESYASKNK